MKCCGILYRGGLSSEWKERQAVGGSVRVQEYKKKGVLEDKVGGIREIVN